VPFLRCGKIKLILIFATLVARNAKESIVVPMLGPGRVLRLAGVCSQTVGLCLRFWQRFGFNRREEVLTFI
jgi:hypothetical protein